MHARIEAGEIGPYEAVRIAALPAHQQEAVAKAMSSGIIGGRMMEKLVKMSRASPGRPLTNIINELHFMDSRRTKLSKVVTREKSGFAYEYDFGDSWEHQILVEKILPPEPGGQYPVCLAGKRACPPEDCGGIWGYDELLETIRDPLHEEYESMMEWLGGSFDPEEFDDDLVNRLLRRSHQAKRPRRANVPAVFRQAFESKDKKR